MIQIAGGIILALMGLSALNVLYAFLRYITRR